MSQRVDRWADGKQGTLAGRRRRPSRWLPHAALVALSLPGVPTDVPTLHPGDRTEVVPAATGYEFRVEPRAPGALTILVESLDGDVRVRLQDGSGAILAEDDDGGIEWNARLVLSADLLAARASLVAGFGDGSSGTLVIEVFEGESPKPQGREFSEQTARFLEARSNRRSQLGQSVPAAADLFAAGCRRFDLQQFELAHSAFTRLMPLLEAVDDPVLACRARALLASSAFRSGLGTDPLPLLREAADATRATGLAVEELVVREDLAQACEAAGDLLAARAELERVVAVARQAGMQAQEVMTLCRLASACLDAGLADEARQACESARERAEATGDVSLQVEALAADARWHASRGRHMEAAELRRMALALAADPWQSAVLSGERGDSLRLLGDLAGAADAYRAVGAIAADLGDPWLVATASAGLGMLQREQGDLPAAQRSLEVALNAWGGTGMPANRVVVLGQLAAIEADLGNREAALLLVRQAQELAFGLGSPALEAMVGEVETYVHTAAWDWSASEASLRRQLDRLLGQDLPEHEANALQDLAQAVLRQGRLDEAEELAQRALELRRAAARDYDLLHPLFTLAEAALKRRDAERAESLLERIAAAMNDAVRSGIDLRNLQDLRSRWLEQTAGRLPQDLAALRLELAGEDPRLREQALEAGLRAAGEWKGHALLLGVQAQRRGGADAEAMQLLAERRGVLADRDAAGLRLAEAMSGQAAGGDREALLAEIAALDGRLDGIARRLAQVSPREAALDAPAAIDVGALRGVLSPGDVYVEYAESIERLYAYAITHEAASMRDLGPWDEVARDVTAYVDDMSVPEHLVPPSELAQRGRLLFDRLLGGVLPSGTPPGARLVIVPSAAVAALPFEALVVRAADEVPGFGSMTFVLDEHEVVYAPSGPVLALMQRSGARARPGDALVLGDPLYDAAAGTSRGVPPGELRAPLRLPGTRVEALELSARLMTPGAGGEGHDPLAAARASESIVLDAPGLRLLLGAAATPRALAGDLTRFSLVHCAAHGEVDPLDARLTGLRLSPSGDDDGFLSLGDVLELSFDADLAVLSACETGRGAERLGEGTQSLARAFLHAGARGVVASLWRVDDRETTRIMQGFYDGMFAGGLTASAALRQARLAIRSASPEPGAFRATGRGDRAPGERVAPVPEAASDLAGHPYFWAAFTYVGPTDLKPLAPR